jgi:hypothetical protein
LHHSQTKGITETEAATALDAERGSLCLESFRCNQLRKLKEQGATLPKLVELESTTKKKQKKKKESSDQEREDERDKE